MRYTVVLTAEFPPILRELLAPHFDVVSYPTEHERSEDEMITILAEADGAVTLLSDPVTRAVMESNPHLRVVSNFAVGYNNVDVDAARELGVVIGNTPGVLTEATADLTMALILAVTRRLVEADDEVRTRGRCEWTPAGLLGSSLQGRTLGIVGMGRIGQAVAARARAFGLEVVGAGRDGDLEALLAVSDIVSLHAPLTPSTHHLIGRTELQRMKRGSYLVNTARGALVDEGALCDALESGHLAGAGLDVFEFEPEVDPRLLRMKNVVLLPHIGSATHEARNAMARIAAANVFGVLLGGDPAHRVV